ncbi:MAG: TPM domain-containing protein [Verrucomicrobiota bacterium]
MTSIKPWLAIPILLVATLLPSQSQLLPDWQAQHAAGSTPEIGILDNARFFSRDQETLARINAGIVQLNGDHGYRIHLVIVNTLIGTTAQEQANELRRVWLPEGNGLVIVFESDNRNFGVGQDMDGNPLVDRNPHSVPAYETSAIVSSAIANTDGQLSTPAYLESVMGGLVGGFDRYFINRQKGPPSQRSVRIALLGIGAVSVLGLGAIATGGLIRHTNLTRSRRFHFPASALPERLSAPCGALVAARRFTRF